MNLGRGIKMRSSYEIYQILEEQESKKKEEKLIFQSFNFNKKTPKGEPVFTSHNVLRSCTLDYIFYNSLSLNLVSLLKLPSIDLVESEDGPSGWFESYSQSLSPLESQNLLKRNGIPNSLFPSDHLPILAVFEYKL